MQGKFASIAQPKLKALMPKTSYCPLLPIDISSVGI